MESHRLNANGWGKWRFWLVAVVVAVLGIALVGCASEASAPKYPTKPITALGPWAAGGGADTIGRLVGPKVAEKWGVTLTVVNKPGGQGIPGTLEMLNAAPDGYTVLVECGSTSSVLSAWGKEIPFKVDERTYLARAVTMPNIIYVRADVPWKNLDDVAEAIRRDPANIKFGWMGGTGPLDVPIAQFRAALMAKGVDLSKTKMVTYQGGGELAPAIAGGHIDLTAGSGLAAASVVTAGKARVIAIAGDRRLKTYPEALSASEQGWPTVNAGFWVGFSGPKNLPKNVVQSWMDTVKSVVNDSAMVPEWDKVAVMPSFLGGDEFKQFVVKEMEEIKALPIGQTK